MATGASGVAATAVSSMESCGSDGPVLSFMNKRLRALRKKYNRIVQMEESIAQGKPINKEQEEVLKSKPSVLTLIDELEKLRQPLSSAVQEEISLATSRSTLHVTTPDPSLFVTSSAEQSPSSSTSSEGIIEDLLKLVYFGNLFDVKPQSDFTSTMLTRTHERGCCLTYDYVTDDATYLLGENDLDMISMLGALVISRPTHSTVSHKNALISCVQHARLWLSNSDQPIHEGTSITYAGLRERLNKILASDYFTTTPEIKAPVDVVAAAAAGKYAQSQVLVHESLPSPATVQMGDELTLNQDKDDHESGEETQAKNSCPDDHEYNSVEELSKVEESVEPSELAASEHLENQQQFHPDFDEQNDMDDVETKEHQNTPRRTYTNQRGGRGGGRRGSYLSGRMGRGSRGGGYQNGRNQYYDNSGNYYPRHYYNVRGRGRDNSGSMYTNYGGAQHSDHPLAVEQDSY